DEHWPYAGSMLDGLTARAVDAHTVVVTSSSTKRVPPGLLLHVVPAHVYARVSDLDHDPRALGVGDGPWNVVSRSADSVELGVLGRPGGPPLDQIIFRTYPSAGALIDALARGKAESLSCV